MPLPSRAAAHADRESDRIVMSTPVRQKLPGYSEGNDLDWSHTGFAFVAG